jgi:hypothetical protein
MIWRRAPKLFRVAFFLRCKTQAVFVAQPADLTVGSRLSSGGFGILPNVEERDEFQLFVDLSYEAPALSPS